MQNTLVLVLCCLAGGFFFGMQFAKSKYSKIISSLNRQIQDLRNPPVNDNDVPPQIGDR